MHLNSETFIDLIEGRIENNHPDECPDCGRRLEEWKQLHSRLTRSHLEDAPAAMLYEAHEIMEPRPKIGEIAASVVFDSFTQPVFAGARGSGKARQVVLRAAEFDVHIRISGKSGARQVTGQILSRGDSTFLETAKIHLLHNGSRIRSTGLDPLGEFEFEGMPEGLLSLQIDLPNLTVIGALENEEIA